MAEYSLLEDYKTIVEYKRNDRIVYYDLCRQILIPATPEERVRQAFVRYLKEKLGVPLTLLETEVPMSHFKKKGRGRADIVGYYCTNKDGAAIGQYPLFVVECKAPGISLTDEVLEQCMDYDACLGRTGYLFLTNGEEIQFYFSENDDYVLAKEIPTYLQMIEKNNHVFVPEESFFYEKPAFESRTDEVNLDLLYSMPWLGQGSPKENLGYLTNLIAMIQCDDDLPLLPQKVYNGQVTQSGFRNSSFGNAAGGSWPGMYRYFIIEDATGNNQIISMSIIGKCYGEEDSRFPNANGHTMLIVAIDDFEKRHNSLQLDLDKFVETDGTTLSIWHDGTLTAGKRGQARRNAVKAFVEEKCPSLIQNGVIWLGSLPANRYATWNDATDFLNRLITYAFLRDEYRNLVLQR